MPRRQEKPWVSRPRRHGQKWRILIGGGGKTRTISYPTLDEAKQGHRRLLEGANEDHEKTVKEALDEYECARRQSGGKEESIMASRYRIEGLITDGSVPIRRISTADLQRSVDGAGKKWAPDTTRNALSEVSTFFRWCARKGIVRENPCVGTDRSGIGKRRRGKPQLRPREARELLLVMLGDAERGQEVGLAGAMALLLGLRQSELTRRSVRDVDTTEWVLYVEKAKTQAGNRSVEIPAVLHHLVAEQMVGKSRTDLLFGGGARRTKEWLNRYVKRTCERIGLPVVCAHSLRGVHSTMAQRAGVTSHVVAAALGHESPRTTREHYTDRGQVDSERLRGAQRILLREPEGLVSNPAGSLTRPYFPGQTSEKDQQFHGADRDRTDGL